MSRRNYKIFVVGVVAGVAATKLVDLSVRECEGFIVSGVFGFASSSIYYSFKYGLRIYHWPDIVRGRVITSFKYLGGSIGLTTGAAVLASKIGNFVDFRNCESIWGIIGPCSAMVGSWLVCRYIRYEPGFLSKKHAVWAFRCGVLGSVMANLTSKVPGALLVVTGLSTVGIVGGYVAFAINLPPVVFINWGGRLKIGLGVFTVSSLACFTSFHNPQLRSVFKSISVAWGMVLFSTYVLYHTNKLRVKANDTPIDAPFDPINEHMNLFSDCFWTFMCFLNFLGI